MASTASNSDQSGPESRSPRSQKSWTYPTRTCRLCLEEVPATVTLYPPGLPPAFQRPVVEYKNDDEYGRLIKPCHCRGGMRYIHELCLRRSRTETVRPGSLWKCHQCGYSFNFNRLTLQKYLGSKSASGILTITLMLIVVFLLGFVADPILNLYADPYETIIGHEGVWQKVDLNGSRSSFTGWAQHFVKGVVSMGVISFLRTLVLNPFQWWQFRNTGFVSGRVAGRSTTGRDRAVNISWLVVAMGLLSASYLFYQWVQTIVARSLQRIGNNIVDTQLPGDDDDLKPPPGFRFADSYPDLGNAQAEGRSDQLTEGTGSHEETATPRFHSHPNGTNENHAEASEEQTATKEGSSQTLSGRGNMPGTWDSSAYSSAVDDAQSQGWSFRGL